MTLYEAYKQARSQYPTTASQALMQARAALKVDTRHRFDFNVEEGEVQTVEHKGFFVVVKVCYDEYHTFFDDDSIGTIYGYGDDIKPDNFYDIYHRYPQGEFVFTRDRRWGEELVGFDLGGGETFKGLLGYYRKHMSKQMAFEAAMRQVKSQFEYTLGVYEAMNDNYNQRFEAYGVTAQVYANEEAYLEDEDSYLDESSVWGIEVDTHDWNAARDYINEAAWDCIENAVHQAQRAEFSSLEAAGNVPLFGGI